MSTEPKQDQDFPFQMSEEQWKSKLSPEEYRVLRLKGTEMPRTGQYDNFYEQGHYRCKGCGFELFDSEHKFDSGCGWPSFDGELSSAKIKKLLDTSHGMRRTEILCSNCGGHLGHLFTEGPTESGLRYCVNSASIDFKNKKSAE